MEPRHTLHTAKNRECLWFAKIEFKTTPAPGGKGYFRQDVPLTRALKEKKTAEMTTAPEPTSPTPKETPANP